MKEDNMNEWEDCDDSKEDKLHKHVKMFFFDYSENYFDFVHEWMGKL